MWEKIFGAKIQDIAELTGYDAINWQRLPKHVAIIMDGNGRWAKSRGLMRTFGHKAGVDTLKNIVKAATQLKIEALTVYAFSTENWKRPAAEVEFLMNLFSEYLQREIDEIDNDNMKIQFIGRVDELSPTLRSQIENAQQRTAKNTGLVFSIAVNYGSRAEITRAVKIICDDVINGKIAIDDIDEALIDNNLYTVGLPPLDLVIRPSGDKRVSNFLLWQAAYAELWFTKVNWPDFKPQHLIEAIVDYQQRERRFGGLVERKDGEIC